MFPASAGGMLAINSVTERIIGCAIEVHRALGPGLLESAYQACLAHEFTVAGLRFEQQRTVPVEYKSVRLACGYRLDFIVDESVVVEIKGIDQLAPVHQAQMLSCLRMTGCHVGLLINFHVKLLSTGIKRVVLDLPE